MPPKKKIARRGPTEEQAPPARNAELQTAKPAEKPAVGMPVPPLAMGGSPARTIPSPGLVQSVGAPVKIAPQRGVAIGNAAQNDISTMGLQANQSFQGNHAMALPNGGSVVIPLDDPEFEKTRKTLMRLAWIDFGLTFMWEAFIIAALVVGASGGFVGVIVHSIINKVLSGVPAFFLMKKTKFDTVRCMLCCYQCYRIFSAFFELGFGIVLFIVGAAVKTLAQGTCDLVKNSQATSDAFAASYGGTTVSSGNNTASSSCEELDKAISIANALLAFGIIFIIHCVVLSATSCWYCCLINNLRKHIVIVQQVPAAPVYAPNQRKTA